MNKHRRTAAASAIFTDKGFYAILAASIIMICFAAYLALSWENGTENEPPQNDDKLNTLSMDEVLEDGYVPNWPTEENSSTVGTTENDITDKPSSKNESDKVPAENGSTEPEKVELSQPVAEEDVISVNGFSGSTPVFSESLGDWRLHQGVDFVTEEPADVTAAADGIVEDVYDDGLMGTTVLLLHADGTRTLYQSLSVNPEVIKGMSVTKGYVIGKTGTTANAEALVGCHLHYAIIKDGAYVEPEE
ncbi:MAG: M23 family metallopeptidase [Ruminococcaceae bacterium]|nr:M23 family metallopeptidase [Oscillospiraceae bacterium]